MDTVMKPMPTDVLHNLEEKANRLAARKCPFMAATLLQYYDGDCAEETKANRLQIAQRYFNLARQQAEQQQAQTL
jgi:hypothetical protein